MDYKKILEGVVDIINTTEKSDIGFAKICTYIGENCPELKESEDERIKKEIIEILNNLASQHFPLIPSMERYKKWIAWLGKQCEKVEPIESFNSEFERQISQLIASIINKEHEYTEAFVKWTSDALLNYAKHEIDKQGEQKPTSDTMYEVKASDSLSVGNGKPFDYEHTTITQEDFAPKVEPKFNVGDWIVCCDYEPVQIIGIRTNAYYEMSNGDIRPIYMIDNNNNIRRWTIEDAKKGDVLVASDGSIFLFKDTINNACRHYVALTTKGDIDCNKGLKHYWETSSAVHPATKEQRNLLFQKMHEARYEWDAEKKELKKIEQNSINKIEPKFKVGDYIERRDGLGCHAKIIFVGKNVYGCKKLIYPEDSSPFFKLMFENQDEFKISSDFKQKPVEWSKKDSLYYDDICEILINLLHSESPNVNKSAIQKDLDWFITFVKQTKK